MQNRRARNLFMAPAIIYLLLMTIYPAAYSFYLSVTNKNLVRPAPAKFVGFQNFRELLSDSLFQTGVQNTIEITVASVVIELVIAFLVARLFFAISTMPGNGLIRTVYILPMMLTPAVSGLMWTYILNPTLGVANFLLRDIGAHPYTWFARVDSALKSIVLVNVWQWSPFLMLLILAGLMAIPREQYEAAAIDGANAFDIVRFIELPSLRTVIVIGLMFRIIDNFKMFDIIYVTTRGGPGDATEVVSMYAYRQMFQFFNIGFGSAAAVIILIMGIVISNILYRFIREDSHVV